MNTHIEVLAVMDAACCVLAIDKKADPQKQLEQARAAVAELIEASNEMLRVERTQGVTEAEFEAAVEALDTAMTRVQGGSA